MTSTELGDLFDLLSPLCQQISHHAGPLNLRGFFNLHSSFCTWWWFRTQLRKWNYYVCCSGDVFLISLRHLQNIILNISICIVQSWIVVYGSTFGWMTSTSLPLAAFAVAFFSAFPILGGAGCPAFSSRNRPKSSTSPSKLCICLRRIPNKWYMYIVGTEGGGGSIPWNNPKLLTNSLYRHWRAKFRKSFLYTLRETRHTDMSYTQTFMGALCHAMWGPIL